MATYQYASVSGIITHNDDGSWTHTRPTDPGWQTLLDAITAGTITIAPATPVVIPDPIDYGSDATPDRSSLVTAVGQLRAYLAVATPTQAQSTAALKLLIRVLFYVLRGIVQ